ncbi:phage capsid protein [Lactobacillus crispatus]|nr:phage capsid protein [Lactobacillus crispatus]TDM97036.1 phage capsid protein [Lactobacillus crispatus]TDN08727.1 phage capsid protein [Lactobacillus crispatus]TDN35169.1 phage capsid protein [Lactobacillus crispatus]
MPGTKADNTGFPENFVNRIFIDTKPNVDNAGDVDLDDVTNGSWAWVASGITSQTPSANETTTNDAYYDGGGFTDTDVTGKQIQIAISGNRKVGDPAQDFVEKLFFKFGTSVKTRVIWIKNNLPIIARCTISNIVPTGGNANAKQTFSFNIAFNGRPKIFNGQLTMTATSVAKIYSASVDSSKKAANDDDLVPAVIKEEADATASSGSDTGSAGTGKDK